MKSTNGDNFDSKLLLHVLTAVKNGDFSPRLPAEWTGLHGKIADVFNDIMGLNERFADHGSPVSPKRRLPRMGFPGFFNPFLSADATFAPVSRRPPLPLTSLPPFCGSPKSLPTKSGAILGSPKSAPTTLAAIFGSQNPLPTMSG